MRITLFIFLLFCFSASGQEWQTKPCVGINTLGNEMACCLLDGQVVVSRDTKLGMVSDMSVAGRSFELVLTQKQRTFDTLLAAGPLLDKRWPLDDGPAFFNEADSTLWISSANTLGGGKGGHLGIYSIAWLGDRWGEPRAFEHQEEGFDFAHPWLDESGKRLFFSSNCPGGQGGMDIWFCNQTDAGWSNPIPMPHINSDADELFPTYFNGCLYFSSLRKNNQLDLFRSERKWQWERCEELEPPFNSGSDDFQLVFVDAEKAFLTSDRQGNGDDIWVLTKVTSEEENTITGLVECLGLPVRDVKIQIWNQRGEELVHTKTDSLGRFDLTDIEPEKRYLLKVEGMPPEALEKSYVYFVSQQGKRIRVFKLNGLGTFEFQYLPGDLLADLERVKNEDESILMISLEGQVFENQLGDVGKDEVVYIMDSEGTLLSMAYTSNNGKFSVPELRPISQYTFQLDPQGRELKLLITDGDETKEIAVIDGLARYERLSGEEAIRIVDENHNPLFIKNDEVFIIKDIYYQFDSVNLNGVAQQQLSQLAVIMHANPKISIELSSHTDSRGTDEYNQELSERRAETARNFLLDHDVAAKRIVALGLGESDLTNHCVDDVDCPEELHAKNRRTEIKIKVATK